MERGEFSKRTPILVAVDAAVKVLSTILKVSSGGRGRYDEESTSNSDLSPFSLSLFWSIHKFISSIQYSNLDFFKAISVESEVLKVTYSRYESSAKEWKSDCQARVKEELQKI